MRRSTFIPHHHRYELWKSVGGVLYFECKICPDGTEGHIHIVPRARFWEPEVSAA